MRDAAPDAAACQFSRDCLGAPAYVITYEDDVIPGGPYLACVDCTALARAHDPLDYIESVTSLPRPIREGGLR